MMIYTIELTDEKTNINWWINVYKKHRCRLVNGIKSML